MKESVAAVKPSREKEEGPEKRAPSAEEIDEFFGEAKKSSNQRFQSVLDAEEEDIPVSSREAEGGVSGEWSDDEREEGRGKEKAPPTERLTLDMFMKKRLRLEICDPCVFIGFCLVEANGSINPFDPFLLLSAYITCIHLHACIPPPPPQHTHTHTQLEAGQKGTS